MKMNWKRLLSFVLAIIMVVGVLPTAFAAEDSTPSEDSVEVVTDESQAILQEDIFDEIDDFFELAAQRDSERTLEDYIEATDDIAEMVLASDTYVDGSMMEVGNGFFWQTTTGITCGYFPYQRYEEDGYVAPIEKRNATASALTAFNASSATSKDACLVCPMYSEDSTFEETYGNETKEIATARGGKGWKLLNGNATVTNIAKAFETCGVVIFDSHGNTDWGYFSGGSDGTGEADCVSQANTSYLCISSGTGLTSADMAYVQGTYGTYPHAYGTTSGIYVIDGTAIANHMTKDAPNSLLWMAICLGQATNGLNAPLLSKGVNTVYGYSQSVSFIGDYAYEGTFWDNMIAGKTLASSVSAMKSKYGNWDYSTTMLTALGYSSSQVSKYGYSTIAKAKANYAAFPIVASKEDAYPGQGNVDALQTVTTTMTLSDYGSTGGSTEPTTPSTEPTTPSTEPVAATVRFSVPDGVSKISDVSCNQGEAITLPTVSGTPTNDTNSSTFLGWAEASVDNSTTKPTYYAAGSSYTVTGDTTLYALYTYGSSSSDTSLTAMAAGDTLENGDEIVISAKSASVCLQLAAASSSNYLANYDISGGSVTSACIVGVTAANGGWKLGDSTQGYMYNSSSNYLTVSTSNATTWKLIDNGDGTFYLSTTATTPRYLTCRTDLTTSAANLWRVSSSTSTGTTALTIYRRSASGATYTTVFTPSACQHTNTSLVNAKDATCTEAGYTGDTVCQDCGATVATGSVIPAKGHSYVTTTVAPTVTAQGYDHHVCSVCGDSYDDNYVPALGVDYTVHFSVPEGVDAVGDMTCNSNGSITLPAVTGTPANDSNHASFVGWVSAPVDNSTAKPEVYAAGTSYTASSEVTLYALYSYSTGEGSSDTWTLIFSDSDLKIGMELLLTSSDSSAVAGELSSSYLTKVSGTFDGSTVTVGEDALVLTLGGQSGAYTFANASGQLLGCTGAKKLKWDGTVTTWDISVSDGTAVIASTTASYGSMMYNKSYPRFTTYTSGQAEVQLYGRGSGTTYYTTQFSPAEDCQHTNTALVNAKAATCTEAGYTGDTVCQDCGAVIATGTAVPALGHDYQKQSTVAPTCTEEGYSVYVCSRCKNEDMRDIVDAMGHTEGTPVDNGDGTHTVSCTVCQSEIRTEAHTYVDGACACGAKEAASEPTYDASLKFLSKSFTMGSSLNMVFIASKGTDTTRTVRAEVTKYNADGTTTVRTYTVADGNMNDQTRFVTFTFDGVAAKEMGDKVEAKLFATDASGNEFYGETLTLSLKDFLMNYAQSSNEAQKNLAVALLNYGAAAQVYFDYNYDGDTTKLVNNDLTEEQKVIDIREASATTVVSGDGCKCLTNSVLLESKIVLYAIFNLGDYSSRIDELAAVVTNAATGEGVTRLTLTKGNGTLASFRFDDVSAKNTRTVFNIAIYDGETKISQDLQWSMECMVSSYRAASNTPTEKLNLANAMLAYGDYAAAYLG